MVPVSVDGDVRAVHVFGKLAPSGGGESHGRNRGPQADGVRDKGIGRGVGQDRAEIALICVIGDQPLRPDQWLPRCGGIEVAGAGDTLGAAGRRDSRANKKTMHPVRASLRRSERAVDAMRFFMVTS